ncbi:MAG: PspC domain-containing protein [Acidimicrobiales bacterium]
MEPHATPPTPQPKLRRSRTDRVIAGVCGGVAHHLGIDPVLARIVMVVLVVFGGSGLLLYLIGWIVIPSEPEGEGEPAESVLDTAGTTRVVIGAVLIGVGFFTLVDQFVPSVRSLIGPLLLIAAGLGVLLLATDRRSTRRPPDGPDAADAADDRKLDQPVVLHPPPAPGTDPPSSHAVADTDHDTTSASAPDTAPDDRPGRIVLGALLILGGGLWLVDLSGAAELNWRVVLPSALIVVGIATMALACRGRSGALVGWGVVLAFVVAAASALPTHLSVSVGERTERPQAIADLADDYALGMGTLTIDLRDLDLDGDRSLGASVGMGELVVRVPPDVALEVDASVGAGEAQALDRSSDGVGVGLTASFPPSDEGASTDPVTLTLDLSVGLGQIEVRR